MPDTLDPASDILIKGLQRCAAEVLAPRIWTNTVPCEVAIWQPPTRDPVPPRDARAAEYTPVALGHRWGPKWSAAWFRCRATTTDAMAGKSLYLRLSTDTEATFYKADAPHQGLDTNRDAVLLEPAATPGTLHEHYIEAVCNHPWGVVTFDWDTRDTARRWSSDTPGCLDRAELATRDDDAWRLHIRFTLLVGLLDTLRKEGAPTPRARQLEAGLTRAADMARIGEFAACAALVDELLAVPAAGSTPTAIAIGHAHIDTAWLWTIRETRRKVIRSWTNALAVAERYPHFTFLASQAQQYAWLEEDSPEVFARVRSAVERGQIEPAGAMWIESDCNALSAESLFRQIIHGTRYWNDRFPSAPPQRHLFLPDTFGWPASLPQIMRHAGLDTFITNKLHWNGANPFPHTDFIWRGIDGSEVAAHNTPNGDYNSTLSAREQRKALHQHRSPRPGPTPPVYLQPFGFGDGGGGPTEDMAERAAASANCDGLPRTRFATSADFCAVLHDLAHELPVWDDELYLELHRGTLTTQAWLKRANRRAEEALTLAERLFFAGPAQPDADKAARARAMLDKAWKLTLLNQFHDILPGSSITAVYDEARAQHDEIAAIARALTDKALRAWKPFFADPEAERPALVLNPTSFEQSAVVSLTTGSGGETTRKFVKAVPPLGAKVRDLVTSSECVPVTIEPTDEGFLLDNGLVEVLIDDTLRITSLRRSGCTREAVPEGEPMATLALYHDRPHMWDAWDIDAGYETTERRDDAPCPDAAIAEASPLRAAVTGSKNLGDRSRVSIEIALEAGRPCATITYRIEWQEDHTLLRALFPTTLRARTATWEIPAGHLQRPTHRTTPYDAAKFEVPMQRWVDLSEPGLGVAVLNDSKFGGSALDHVLGVSLLKSSTHPDPVADRGRHEITLAVMLHEGDWRTAGVDREAALLNTPLRAIPLDPAPSDAEPLTDWTPVEIIYPEEPDHAARVEVLCLKPAEDDPAPGQPASLILRLAETHGGAGQVALRWGLDIKAVHAVNALEHPLPTEIDHDDGITMLTLRPFEIVTLRALCQAKP